MTSPAPAEPDFADADLADADFARLVAAEAGRLYTLGLRFCGDPDEAEDLVQETFLHAWRGWSGFERRAHVRTWLYTIAARACQRMHRRRAGEPTRIGSLDELLPFGEPRIAAIPGDLDDGLRQQVKQEARTRLETAIVDLPDAFRIPLILKEIVGLPTDDIAGIMQVPAATVRSRVHRARLRLRAAVDAAIPRTPAPDPPAYDRQTCLDLLNAKQDALDRGVPFDTRVICDRCRSVFASLDLTHDVCGELADDALPADVRTRLAETLRQAATTPADDGGEHEKDQDSRERDAGAAPLR